MELEREANSVENEAIQVPKHIIDHKFVKEAIEAPKTKTAQIWKLKQIGYFKKSKERAHDRIKDEAIRLKNKTLEP